jgi:hypothetical protein
MAEARSRRCREHLPRHREKHSSWALAATALHSFGCAGEVLQFYAQTLGPKVTQCMSQIDRHKVQSRSAADGKSNRNA